MTTKAKKQRPKAKRRKTSKKGDALLDQVVKLTGLPKTDIKNELKDILERKNINIHNLNLGQLRCVAASYVREIMSSLVEKYSLRKNDSLH